MKFIKLSIMLLTTCLSLSSCNSNDDAQTASNSDQTTTTTNPKKSERVYTPAKAFAVAFYKSYSLDYDVTTQYGHWSFKDDIPHMNAQLKYHIDRDLLDVTAMCTEKEFLGYTEKQQTTFASYIIDLTDHYKVAFDDQNFFIDHIMKSNNKELIDISSDVLKVSSQS